MIFDNSRNPAVAKEIKVGQEQRSANYLGSKKLHNGMTMYQMEISTGTVTPVSYEYTEVNATNGQKRRKMLVKEGFLYVPALNLENATRKFNKQLGKQ